MGLRRPQSSMLGFALTKHCFIRVKTRHFSAGKCDTLKICAVGFSPFFSLYFFNTITQTFLTMFIFHVACQALFGLCQNLTKDFQLAKGLQSKCFSSDLTKAKDHQRWGALAFYSDVMFVWVSLKEVFKSSCEKLRYKKSSCGRVCVRACVSVCVCEWLQSEG